MASASSLPETIITIEVKAEVGGRGEVRVLKGRERKSDRKGKSPA